MATLRKGGHMFVLPNSAGTVIQLQTPVVTASLVLPPRPARRVIQQQASPASEVVVCRRP